MSIKPIGSVWLYIMLGKEAVVVNQEGNTILFVWKDKNKDGERPIRRFPAADWTKRFRRI